MQRRERLGRHAVFAAVLAAVPVGFARADAPALAAAATPAASDPMAVPDQIVVDLRDDIDTEEELTALEKEFGVDFAPNSVWSGGERIVRARVADPAAAARLVERLSADARVESAELDHLYGVPPFPFERAFGAKPGDGATAPVGPAHPGFPDDPLYKFQWHLDQIKVKAAWPASTGAGVIVAVIDTGVAYEDFGIFKRVPDLAGIEFVAGYDFVDDDEHANDDHGHGTHVAGTIAQATNNALGVAGIAFGAKIMPLKVLNASGMGNTADIADAIRYAADHGAKVINMSLGGPFPSSVLRDAVKYAHKKGVVVVCAAGNDGRGKVGYPAAYEDAIAVSATQFDEAITFYSNWGKDIDIAAPGGNTQLDQNGDGMPDGVLQNTIVAGDPGTNDFLLFMGTSMASPHVAGAAAAVAAMGITDPDAIADVLYDSARDKGPNGWDDHYGHGLLDVGAATRAAGAWSGFWRLGLGVLLAFGVALRLRRREALEVTPGPAFFGALATGAAGLLFFLPLLRVNVPGLALLGQGVPAWDLLLFGAGGHANPLFYSALVPLLAAGLLAGFQRLRGAVAGLSIGIGAHLLHAAIWRPADVVVVPGGAVGDALWLGANAALAVGIGWLVLKKR